MFEGESCAILLRTMIDIKHLRSDPQIYREAVRLKGVTVDIDALLKSDAERIRLIGQVDELRAQLNLKGKPSEAELAKLQQAKVELEIKSAQLAEAEAIYSELIGVVPNLLADGTPEGGEEHNRPERHWGEASTPIPEPKDHLAIAEANDWLDFERGTKVAGSKFYFLKGAAVRLEMSVMRLAMDQLEAAGFTLMAVPHLVSTRFAEGTGYLPRGEEDQNYKIEGEDLRLIATAEIPLTGYHADEIIERDKLPLAYVGISPSYRKEAGAYGRYSKGIYRVHQFDKLEMYIYCLPEQSADWHDKLVRLEEEICQSLGIPYQLVRIAAGDMGAPAFKKFDLEYWSPVEQQYRELMSCTNVTDYQSRRLNIRTRGADGKTEFVHTLNGTAIAFSRIFIALLENHQQEDGTIKVPQALQQYYGGTTL